MKEADAGEARKGTAGCGWMRQGTAGHGVGTGLCGRRAVYAAHQELDGAALVH